MPAWGGFHSNIVLFVHQLKQYIMLKNKKTYYQLILDKSSSMQDCVSTTVNGFNEQMQMIRSMKKKFPEQEFLVSLTTFNQDVYFDVDQADPDNIKELVSAYNAQSFTISDINLYSNVDSDAEVCGLLFSTEDIPIHLGDNLNLWEQFPALTDFEILSEEEILDAFTST